MVGKLIKDDASREDPVEKESSTARTSTSRVKKSRKMSSKTSALRRRRSKVDGESSQSQAEMPLGLHGPFLNPPTNLPPLMNINKRICLIQRYLNSLQYDIQDMRAITVKKSRPICGLMECAKEIIKNPQPIKCLEAVILGIHLTNSCFGLDRFPVSFRSKFEDFTHRHAVLILHHFSIYGALGLSRKSNLMFKPLRFMSLADLLQDFLMSYAENGHEVTRIKIGELVSHDPHTYEGIRWNAAVITCNKLRAEDLRKEVSKLQRKILKKTTWHASLSNIVAQESTERVQLKKVTKTNKVSPLKPILKGRQQKSDEKILKMLSVEGHKRPTAKGRVVSLPTL